MMDVEHTEPPPRHLRFWEARAIYEHAAFVNLFPWLQLLPAGDGHPVLVFPGLAASDISTAPMRAFLRTRGYAAYGWDLGRNRGLRPGLRNRNMLRLKEIRERHGRKVSLIGWSLGGIFAREVAKEVPDDVRLVITLGSPFKGHPKATRAWRRYEQLGRPQRRRSSPRCQPASGAAGTYHVNLQPQRRHRRLAVLHGRRPGAHRKCRGAGEPSRSWS